MADSGRVYGMVQKPALVAPRLPVPQQVGDQWGDLGPKGHFWNNAEEYWKPTFEAIDNIWNTYDTIPVHRNKYLTEDINFIAESGRSANILNAGMTDEGYIENDGSMTDDERRRAFGTEGDDYYGTFGFENSPMHRPTENLGMYLDVPFGRWQEGVDVGYLLDDRLDRPTTAISDKGWQEMQPGYLPPWWNSSGADGIIPAGGGNLPFSSVGMHELGGHYYDNLIAGQDELAASEIMQSYATGNPAAGGAMIPTQENFYEQWMNDPRTAHLDLNDPTNTGLRTLLGNRLHHGGVVNPREGFGEYISTALTDPNYQTVWDHPGYPQHVKDYKLSNAEIFARAAGNTLRPQVEDEGFGTITPDLDRTFANSLATYLNSR